MGSTATERRGRGDGGATGVEYAVVMALLVVAGLGGAKFLTSRANSQVSNQADCVATRPPPPSCQVVALTTSTTGVPASSTSSTGLPVSTTAPPTANAAASAVKGTPVVIGTGTYPTINISITITRNPGGAGVTGALPQFKVVLHLPGGVTRTDYVSCTNATDSTGKCTVTYQSPYSDTPQTADVTITNLNAPIGTGVLTQPSPTGFTIT